MLLLTAAFATLSALSFSKIPRCGSAKNCMHFNAQQHKSSLLAAHFYHNPNITATYHFHNNNKTICFCSNTLLNEQIHSKKHWASLNNSEFLLALITEVMEHFSKGKKCPRKPRGWTSTVWKCVSINLTASFVYSLSHKPYVITGDVTTKITLSIHKYLVAA